MDRGERAIVEVRRVTFIGMAVNLLIAVGKGAGGIVWSSQALFADAIHSLSDLVTDLAVIFGVKYWSAPADNEHPYGHGKIEALVTLFIALALGIVAWELGCHTIDSLKHRSSSVPGMFACIVAVISIVLKEWMFRWTRAVARRVKSPALEANAWHHRSDAMSSVPVAVAVAVEWFFPSLWWIDEIGALIVVLFIVHVAWEIARPALQELVDAGIDDKTAAVEEVARRIPGVISVHQARVRRYGGAFMADLHIQVSSSISLAEGHALGHEVKHAIQNADLDVYDAIVHVEPADVRAIVSLGSNVEPRGDYLKRALKLLSEMPCTHFVKASTIIETDPIDVPSEFANQKFLNQIAVFETALDPHDFARRMHHIEDELGRVRTVRNGPRTIDIDLIDFDGLHLSSEDLILPHPRAKSRAFVTAPMTELGLSI